MEVPALTPVVGQTIDSSAAGDRRQAGLPPCGTKASRADQPPIVCPTKRDTPEKILDAAQQFEALLLAQMLRSIRESSKGWLGGDDSATSDTATEFAEQQFAVVLARQGGLGLAHLIARGLEPHQ